MGTAEDRILRVPIKKTRADGWLQTYWIRPSWHQFDHATRQLFAAPPTLVYGSQTPENGTKRAIRAIFGRELYDSEWGRLVAAVAGSELRLNGYEDPPGEFGVYADVVNSPITSYAERAVFLSADGERFMVNRRIARATGARAGSVRRAIAVQIMTARALGIQRIVLEAGGPPGYSGYAVWPLLGFDGPLEPDTHAAVIHKFELSYGWSPRTVIDVARNDYQLWRGLGESFYAEFSLATHSDQWDILLKYLEKEGIYRP